MENISFKDLFVFGTQYYRPPTPLNADWKRDLKRIKECGLNTIKIWCIWGWMEPEQGKYRFDEIDKLFDLAGEAGLKVVPNTIVESQPFWITRVCPDSNMVNHKGEKIISGLRNECFVGLTPGQCFDYDKVNTQAEKFLTTLASRYKDRKNLLAWDAWNEIMWQVGAEGLLCYCPATIKKFRIWLKEKYKNLDNLNRAWMRIYSNWDDVFPPRAPRTGYPDMLDWRRFIIYKVTKMAESRVNALKKGDPNHPVMIHTGGSSIGYVDSHQVINGLDDWKLAKTADFYGTSFYPNVFMPESTPSKCALCLDAIRSTSKNKPFWISELQGGPSSSGFIKKDITPEEQRLQIFSCLSKGAKGILFWQWRKERLGVETDGYGLTNSDGSLTKRTGMAKDIAQILNRYSSLFNKARGLASDAAILFDPDTYILNWVSEFVPGSGNSGSKLVDLVDHSIQGYYKAFWGNNIQCDFIHAEDLSRIKNYKILVLPFPFLIKKQTAKIIKEYVQNGGIVISDAYLGKFGENCLSSVITPGSGLDEIFQTREVDVKQKEKIEIKLIKDKKLFEGVKGSLTGFLFKNSLEGFREGKVIAVFEDGKPAIIQGKYGEGRTFYFGSLMGLAYLKGFNPNFKRLIRNLCRETEIFPLVEIESNHFVETRILEGKDYYLLFCLNHQEEVEVTLKIHLSRGKYKVEELLSGNAIPCKFIRNSLLITTNIARSGVKLFLINYSGIRKRKV